MDMTQDRKTGITRDLIKELISEMKGSAGKKFKPAAVEIIDESKPAPAEEHDDGDPESGLKEHLQSMADAESHDDDMDLDGMMEDMPDDGEDNDEPLTGASARLAKLAEMRKRGC